MKIERRPVEQIPVPMEWVITLSDEEVRLLKPVIRPVFSINSGYIWRKPSNTLSADDMERCGRLCDKLVHVLDNPQTGQATI